MSLEPLEQNEPKLAPRPYTKEFYINNLEQALEYWDTVPRTAVVENLDAYHCGTAHCFGGWLPFFGHFKALGVMKDMGIYMKFPSGYVRRNNEVGEYLFGCFTIFCSRGCEEECLLFSEGRISSTEVSDHDFVTARLNRELDILLGESK